MLQGNRRKLFTQGNGQGVREPGAGRKPPQNMPRDVPSGSRVPKQTAKPKDILPQQKAIGDDELVQAPPKRWVVILKRVCVVVLVGIALLLAYVFLLLGEPEDLSLTQTPKVAEEAIRVPMAAMEAQGDADLGAAAASFGKPVLALYGGLNLQKCSLYDTAFQGAYARRVTLAYAFPDGRTLLVESVRPTAAVALLEGTKGASIQVDGLFKLGSVDAARLDTSTTICVVGENGEAAYAVTCPVEHVEELGGLLKQTTLLQPKVPGM